MKRKLLFKVFDNGYEVIMFINKHNISQQDIQALINMFDNYELFYWREVKRMDLKFKLIFMFFAFYDLCLIIMYTTILLKGCFML